MKITDIKQQVKTQGRYSIFIDGKFSFGLSELALMNSGIRIGHELSAEELHVLKDTARTDKAYTLALGQLARRPRSEWEMRDYLKRKEYEPELVQQIIDKLYEGNWLSDLDFARRWIENRRLLKSMSRRRLTQELKAKRVSDAIITEAMAEDEVDDSSILKELIVRKQRQTRYQDPQKLIAYLMRQGYNYQDIKTALEVPEDR